MRGVVMGKPTELAPGPGTTEIEAVFMATTWTTKSAPDHIFAVRSRFVLVGDTGFEPVTSSVSGKRATAAPIARVQGGAYSVVVFEVGTGFEPV
jgi:hypothetical protein